MTRNYFDVVIIVPLEEELRLVQRVFLEGDDYSTATQYRYTVSSPDTSLRLLLVQQDSMGRTSASRVAESVLQDFAVGLIVCLGMAGGLSKDFDLGDVVYTGSTVDVYDNAKVMNDGVGQLSLAFSPTWYQTPLEISAPIGFMRTMPQLRGKYSEWLRDRRQAAEELFTDEPNLALRPSKNWSPKAASGTVVCGSVSASTAYNDRLHELDRKIVAIDTESGGIFEVCKRYQTAALTVRGISDYADAGKSALESGAKGKFRELGARPCNAICNENRKNVACLRGSVDALFHGRVLTCSINCVAQLGSGLQGHAPSSLQRGVLPLSPTL